MENSELPAKAISKPSETPERSSEGLLGVAPRLDAGDVCEDAVEQLGGRPLHEGGSGLGREFLGITDKDQSPTEDRCEEYGCEGTPQSVLQARTTSRPSKGPKVLWM